MHTITIKLNEHLHVNDQPHTQRPTTGGGGGIDLIRAPHASPAVDRWDTGPEVTAVSERPAGTMRESPVTKPLLSLFLSGV